MTEEGADYQEVLKDAQALGYAEANPVADVEGYDSSYKLSILSSLAFNKRVPVELIYREGITNIGKEDIKIAKDMGFVIKLLAIAKQKDKKIEARGDIMIYGRGAGALPTGSAIVSDIVFCARQVEHARYGEIFDVMDKNEIITDFESEYYLRLNVRDVSGVVADIAAVFKKHKVSIAQMRQDENKEIIPIVFITHKTSENAMKSAIEDIKKLANVISVENVIRVEK